MIGTAIANHRYVVVGEVQRPDRQPRRWAIAATDDRAEAEQVLKDGREVNGNHWKGIRIHDRRTEGILPQGGWGS